MCVMVVFLFSVLIQAFGITASKDPVAPVVSVFSKVSATPQELCLLRWKMRFSQLPQGFSDGRNFHPSGTSGIFLVIFCQAAQIGSPQKRVLSC